MYSITRRSFVVGSLSSLLLAPSASRAENACGYMGCTAQVSFSQFATAYQSQMQSEWCWAACISMLFSYYGHPVSQGRVVTDAYGSPENIPALNGALISSNLNRSWVDDNGESFEASLQAAFDPQFGLTALNQGVIVQALINDQPLIVGSHGHATVMTEAQYTMTPAGPHILSIGVFDPWPGIGARNLMQQEMNPPPYGTLEFMAFTSISS